MSKKLNISIIGCGTIFRNHSESAINSPYCAGIVSVCDINAEKLAKAASAYGCGAVDDYMDIVRDSKTDVVHICTPHYLHAPMALEAMRHGKHVLTEKPMAMSPEDAEQMIKVSEETGMKLGVCFQNRYNFASVKAMELITSGEVGEIKGAKGYVTWYRSPEYYTGSGWRGTWEKEGGGVLINQSIHTLDLLNCFTGSTITGLKARVSTNALEGVIEVEDTADVHMRTSEGAPVLFYATNAYCKNSDVEIEIVCDKAVMSIGKDITVRFSDKTEKSYEDEKAEYIKKMTGAAAAGVGTGSGTGTGTEATDGAIAGDREGIKAGVGAITRERSTGTMLSATPAAKAYWGSSHSLLINDFYKSIIENTDFAVDGKEGIKSLKLIKAIYRSSATGNFASLY